MLCFQGADGETTTKEAGFGLFRRRPRPSRTRRHFNICRRKTKERKKL